MAIDYVDAEDAILGALKTQWDADTPALNRGVVPQLVYEAEEQDLKPHPRDGTAPWARVVVRHADAMKVTLNNDVGTARYRRVGLVWIQVFAPANDATGRTLGQRLAMVAQKAYEGKRAANGEVVFTRAAISERLKDGPWFLFDVKVSFYWDQIR